MIYQYFYGRSQNGYGQLGDVKELNLSTADKTILGERLNSYKLLSDMNLEVLPECFYFYSTVIQNKLMGIVGKTTFVPAATSQASGYRGTSFAHKYLFDGEDYQALIAKPNKIFEIGKFYSNVEEYQNGGILEKPGLFKSEEDHKDFRSVMQKLELTQVDVHALIYALLHSCFQMNCRVYITLPENSQEMTFYAKEFIQRVMKILPPILVSRFGFLTYTGTFHEALSNPIPAGINLVFIARDNSNTMKYEEIGKKNYLIDGKYQKNLIMELNPYTRNLLQVLYNTMAYGDNNGFLIKLLENLIATVNYNEITSPEIITAVYEFYTMFSIKENKIIKFDSERITFIFDQLFGTPNLLKQKITEDINLFVTIYCSTITEIIKVQLKVLDCLFQYVLPKREDIIKLLCNALLTEMKQKKDSLYHLILEYELGEELKFSLYDTIYKVKEYQPIAVTIIEEELIKWEKVNTLSQMEKITKIYTDANSLYQKYPVLVKSSRYIEVLEQIFTKLMLQQDLINYSDIYAFYNQTSDFGKAHDALLEYEAMAIRLVKKALDRIPDIYQLNEIDKNILRSWDFAMVEQLKNAGSMNASILWKELLHNKYKNVLHNFALPYQIKFLLDRPISEVVSVLRQYPVELNELLIEYLHSLTNYDDYRLFFLIAFPAYPNKDDIIEVIGKKEGITGIAKLWNGVPIIHKEEQAQIKETLRLMIRLYLKHGMQRKSLLLKGEENKQLVYQMLYECNLLSYAEEEEDREDIFRKAASIEISNQKENKGNPKNINAYNKKDIKNFEKTGKMDSDRYDIKESEKISKASEEKKGLFGRNKER